MVLGQADKYGSKWSREELILAFYLYCQIPFGKCTDRVAEVQELAALIGRTPSSVARKLGNFGAFDPKLAARGVSGLTHAGKLDLEVWNEFSSDWEKLVEEAELLLEQMPENLKPRTEPLIIPSNVQTEAMSVARIRLRQGFFRRAVLSSYESGCCITGINLPKLLVASHIIPWAEDKNNRLNPCNGLCLNALHDAAFDKGLISLDDDFRLVISGEIKSHYGRHAVRLYFERYANNTITLPQRFLPNQEFLAKHRRKWGFE